MKAESATKVSIFYMFIVPSVLLFFFKHRRVYPTIWAESVTNVSLWKILVIMYYCWLVRSGTSSFHHVGGVHNKS